MEFSISFLSINIYKYRRYLFQPLSIGSISFVFYYLEKGQFWDCSSPLFSTLNKIKIQHLYKYEDALSIQNIFFLLTKYEKKNSSFDFSGNRSIHNNCTIIFPRIKLKFSFMAENWTRCIYVHRKRCKRHELSAKLPSRCPSPSPPLNNFLRRILKFRTIISSHLEFCTTEIVEFLANCLQRRSTVKLALFVICSVRSFGPLRLLSLPPVSDSTGKRGGGRGPSKTVRAWLSLSLSIENPTPPRKFNEVEMEQNESRGFGRGTFVREWKGTILGSFGHLTLSLVPQRAS